MTTEYRVNVEHAFKEAIRTHLWSGIKSPIKAYLTLPGLLCGDIKDGLDRGIITPNTRIVAFEKCSKYVPQIESRLQELGCRNAKVYACRIETARAAKIIETSHRELPFDIAYIDLCGELTPAICAAACKLRAVLKSTRRVGITLYVGGRVHYTYSDVGECTVRKSAEKSVYPVGLPLDLATKYMNIALPVIQKFVGGCLGKSSLESCVVYKEIGGNTPMALATFRSTAKAIQTFVSGAAATLAKLGRGKLKQMYAQEANYAKRAWITRALRLCPEPRKRRNRSRSDLPAMTTAALLRLARTDISAGRKAAITRILHTRKPSEHTTSAKGAKVEALLIKYAKDVCYSSIAREAECCAGTVRSVANRLRHRGVKLVMHVDRLEADIARTLKSKRTKSLTTATVEDMAKSLGCSADTIKRRAENMNLEFQNRKRLIAELERAIIGAGPVLYAPEVAHKLGCHESTVHNTMKRLIAQGVKVPQRASVVRRKLVETQMRKAERALIKYGGKYAHRDIAKRAGVPYSCIRRAGAVLKSRGVAVATKIER